MLADILYFSGGLAAFALIGFSALHVAAALKHRLVDDDGVLERMLPRWRRG